MERRFVDPEEMNKRMDLDYMASLDMLDEGAPVHYQPPEPMRTFRETDGFGEEELPQAYQ